MIQIFYLGRMGYGEALGWQERLAELRKQDRIPNTILFVEHPPVITLGRNARPANVLASPELLASRGVEVVEINRGGDVTLHAPGQLVAYPVFDLRTLRVTPEGKHLGAVDYVRLLEEVLMRTVVHYGIETQRIAGLTGVWTYPDVPPRLAPRSTNREYNGNNASGGPFKPSVGLSGSDDISDATPTLWTERKIAAIGVHISRGVTTHGFALNVTTELDLYKMIVPCGLTKPVTSIEFETGLKPPLEEVMHHASRCFGELLGEQILWLENIEELLPAVERQQTNNESLSPKNEDAPCDIAARPPESLRRLLGKDTHLA